MRGLWLAAALLLTSCAGLAEPGAGGAPDDSVVSTPVDATPEPGPSYEEVQPREGLVDIAPHIWDSAKPIDDRTVRVEFYGGVKECDGLDRVEVDETADSVTITLYTGRVPEAEVCIEIAVLKAVKVELDSPLGGREIVDGAA
ncbi:MAG: hypothetical protein ACRDH9_08305 [Actinomycetota bacterium]